MDTKEIVAIIILGTLILLFFCFAIILFVLYYMKTKKFHQQQLQNEILKTEIDSIEKTSSLISHELHDNVVTHLYAVCIMLQEESVDGTQLKFIHGVVDSSVEQLRSLSRSLIAHHVDNINLSNAIKNEIRIYQNLNNVAIEFENDNAFMEIPKEKQLMLLRITQEALNNAIKHSGATKIIVELNHKDQKDLLKISDNGKGFDSQDKMNESNGLINMRKRAGYINADLNINSVKGSGTEISVLF